MSQSSRASLHTAPFPGAAPGINPTPELLGPIPLPQGVRLPPPSSGSRQEPVSDEGFFSRPEAQKDERPRDAATVVLLRPQAGAAEVFLVKRHGKSAFMGGAYVFPGGKLDDADREVAALVGEEVANRCQAALDPTPGCTLSRDGAVGLFAAAARELFEEAGVLLVDGVTDVAPYAGWRSKLQEGETTFAELLRSEGLTPSLDRLAYWSHWITPSLEKRRYDTRFFLVCLPEGQTPIHDRKETTEEVWLTASDALAAQARGEVFLPPPTQRTLEEIGEGDAEGLIRRAHGRTVAAILPKIAFIDERITILLPWDPEYAATEGDALDVPDPHPQAAAPSRMTVVP